ncbi:arylsulfatase [Ruania alba]|uniref:Arylsulfatase n=1 Tax=Ruania alba TaxID=648782 RepID=A0A1H5B749_9MICO|nr:arylsulfatase [Ruania alba]SED50146.1 arylsulfatase [Ruania alba]
MRPAPDRPRRPNVVIILADDLGYSDIGSYGGEINTPNLDALAARGVRMSQFYNTARCAPSRASLLTGLHPHQTGIGVLVNDDGPGGYPGRLNDRCVTIAEVLGGAGYSTYMCGKWHVTGERDRPDDSWPTRRGFDHFFGTIDGAANYWNPVTLTRDETPVAERELPEDFFYTDAISDAAAEFITAHDGEDPFFMYVAYTAPHWPLHAREEDIEAYRGRYDGGWDELRRQRHDRLKSEGIVKEHWPLSERDPDVPAWDEVDQKEWQARRMEVYAAQVEVMDAGIGRIIATLEDQEVGEDTIVLFLSDNGGCAEGMRPGYLDEAPSRLASMLPYTRDGERVFRGNVPEVMPGPESTYASYGRGWANLSNTPFREYKHWVHEGGIATPLIASWPAGLTAPGVVRERPHQLPDIMATILEVTGATYPRERGGHPVHALEGISMLATWRGEADGPERPLFWEHEGNAALRHGRWKLVRKYPGLWELYDIETDRTERHDLASVRPDMVDRLADAYQEWADRCGVIPRDRILALAER